MDLRAGHRRPPFPALPRLSRRAALAAPAFALGLPSCASVPLPAGLPAGRPRLLATPAEVAGLPARLAAHETGRRWRDALLREAGRLLAQPPVERKFEPRRPVLLPTSREVLKRVENLGVAWLLTKDQRFARRIGAELEAACAFPSWNPSHFLDVAEMAMAVSLAVDWCHDALDPAIRARAIGTLVSHALEPGLAEFRRASFWTRATHNWALVCAGGLVAASIVAAEAAPELAGTVLDASIATARAAFASYGPDGGWDEGPGYWDYATQYAVFLCATLESAFGHDFGLGASPGFARTGLFRLHMEGPTGLSFNFGDNPETPRATPALMWLARRFGNPIDAWTIGRVASVTGTGVLWFDPPRGGPARLGIPRVARFGRVEAATLRDAWEEKAARFVALKAGDNGANHSNLDIGSFVLDAGGERFAMELGPDDYSLPGYFSGARRYGWYRTSTRGQNTLLVDGAEQPLRASARLLGALEAPGFARAVADLGPAYPRARSALRGAAILGARGMLLADDIDLPEGARLRWQMHTRASVQVDGASATLARGATTLHARILEPAGASFVVEPATMPAPENPNAGISRLCVDMPGGAGLRVRIAFAAGAPPDEAELAPGLRKLRDWLG
jgi:hypothetical protein